MHPEAHSEYFRGTDGPKLAVFFLDHLVMPIEQEVDGMHRAEIIRRVDAQSASSVVGDTLALVRDRLQYAIQYKCELVGLGLRLWL